MKRISALSIILHLFLIASVAFLTQGKATEKDDYYNYSDDEALDDYEYYSQDGYNEEEIKDIPEFLSKTTSHTFDKETTIRLPCYVDKMPEDFVILWSKLSPKNVSNYIAVGNKLMTNDTKKRFSVEINHSGSNTGSTLVIALAEQEDEGIYTCEMGSNSRNKIIHTVHVRAPPSITKVPHNGLLIAHKGDTISLSCNGQGTPPPTITWTRMDKNMPNGDFQMTGDEITFQNANRHHSGTYICTANNGFSAPAEDRIEVHVNYPPEIEAEEVYIHAQAGNEVELVCNIHAHPMPIVKWFKNSMELTKDMHTLDKHGHKYTLTLKEISKSDFGNYTCRAKNSLGEASRILEVSGKAGYPDFSSNPQSIEPDSYLIEWSSLSTSELTNFELKVRKRGSSNAWHSYEVRPHRLGNFRFAGKHNLKFLEAATQYEAIVAAQNALGWSRHSPIFHFATFGADSPSNVPVSDAATGGSQSLTPPCVALIFVPLCASLLLLGH